MELKGLFMRNSFPSLFVLVIIAIVGILAYLLGKRNASKEIDKVVMNNVVIQQIAELSALEVQGNTSIRSSNLVNDGSFTDGFKKLFLEKTVNISVPYIAKYGIDMNHQNINIEEKNKKVYIVFPEPKLLSYELRLDKVDAVSRKGLLESTNEEMYNRLMQKLYVQSKAQLENVNNYKESAKEKIRKIITAYYEPLTLKVEVSFTNDLKSKVKEKTLQ